MINDDDLMYAFVYFIVQKRIIDNMPVTSCYQAEGQRTICYPGFPVGCFVNELGKGKDGCETLVNYAHSLSFSLECFSLLGYIKLSIALLFKILHKFPKITRYCTLSQQDPSIVFRTLDVRPKYKAVEIVI